jgi:hypothetical protein
MPWRSLRIRLLRSLRKDGFRSMFRTFLTCASIVTFASMAAMTGCSPAASSGPADSGGQGDDGAPTVCPPSDLTVPVSFMGKVLPIFQHSCALGGTICHGDSTGSPAAGRPYLGEPTANEAGLGDPTTILMGIVGVKSVEDPMMDVIQAGDPTNSFLMHKMDGDQGMLSGQCVAMASATMVLCGVSMPFGNITLDCATRDTVRAWIKQGAMNN